MKYLKSILILIIATMTVISCSSESLLVGVDNKTDTKKSNDYVDISVKLPDLGRGWTVAKYKVTASKSGESDVTKETSDSSLTMTLKVGTWSFVASAYDSNNNIIFKSAAQEHAVTEASNNISLILRQQDGAIRFTFREPATAIKNVINKYVVRATPSVSGFDVVEKEVTSYNQSVTIDKLLANVDYSFVGYGYQGDILYAQSTSTSKKITSIGEITSGTQLTLAQKKVSPLTFNYPSGSSFGTTTYVKITTETTGTGKKIYYTTDGSTPTTSSTQYSSTGIKIDSSWSSGKTIKAICYITDMTQSEIATAFYSYGEGLAQPPTFSKTGGTYTTDIEVAITNNESSETLKYSFDNINWSTYTSPISISGNGTTKTIYAKVTDVDGKGLSAVVSQTYTIAYNQLGAVTISPSAGSYYKTQAFTLEAPLATASIYYTTDGTNPTTSSTKYTAPFTLLASATPYEIKAICVSEGYEDSAVISLGSYTIYDDSAINLKTAKNLLKDANIWVSNGLVNLTNGNNLFVATGLSGSTTYEIKWLKSSLEPTITIYKNNLDTQVTATEDTAKYTFNTGSATTSDKFYFVVSMTEAANNVLLGLGVENSVIPVTSLAITPASVSGMFVGSTQKFDVTYNPSSANFGKDVVWSVSNSSVLQISGSEITVVGTGSSNVIVATIFDNGPTAYTSVVIGSMANIEVTVPDWIWNDNAVIKAWVWGASSSGNWESVSGSSTTATFSVLPDTVGFTLVRCVAGTITPDWTIGSGDDIGRVYNKTNDVAYVVGTTAYDTTDMWVNYGSVDTMIATSYNTNYGEDIYFGYRIYDENSVEIQEWINVAGTWTDEGDGYNWYTIIPGVTGGATISWKAYMKKEGQDDYWMAGDNRSTPIGTNQISAW